MTERHCPQDKACTLSPLRHENEETTLLTTFFIRWPRLTDDPVRLPERRCFQLKSHPLYFPLRRPPPSPLSLYSLCPDLRKMNSLVLPPAVRMTIPSSFSPGQLPQKNPTSSCISNLYSKPPGVSRGSNHNSMTRSSRSQCAPPAPFC